MAVTMEALRYGLRGRNGLKQCPVCGHPMQHYRRDGDGLRYAQCLNPSCPHLKNKEPGDTTMPVMTATKAEFETLPTADYLAQITDYEEETGNYGPQFKFTFEIVSPKAYAGKTRLAWCSQKLTSGQKKSKLWTWVEAAYNRPISEGEAVDIDSLVGRQVVLTLISETRDDGSEVNKVSAVKAYKKQDPFPIPQAATQPLAGMEAKAAGADEEDPFSDE